MGRDVGSDEGREQAEWRDLVARLELQAPIDPADAPWPDRENLRSGAPAGTVGSTGGSGPSGPGADGKGGRPGGDGEGGRPGGGRRPVDGRRLADSGRASDDQGAGDDTPPGDDRSWGDAGGDHARAIADTPRDDTDASRDGSDNPRDDTESSRDGSDGGDPSQGGRRSGDRGRVIRPAGFTRFGVPVDPAATAGTEASQSQQSDADDAAAETGGIGDPTLPGPRDYELDEPSDADLDDWNDRYIPPPLPPQPGLDPVAKGAWLALFGGPGYLLIATLLNWQIAGWAALTAVIAFIAGFVVLVFRLGDGPSKRDGPDQGAVV